jgi:hypothetical protein
VIDRGGGANGRPMFESNARYYAQLAGAPTTVYDYSSDDGSDDVGTRSRFAAWEHEDGEDAVYLAWHTNAPSPARGTSSFVYGPSSYGPISEFSGTAGSVELVTAVHDELVADARAGWQADWQDRGLHSAYFGEVNPNHNPEMPAALFEIAFHDTAEDADALRDPRFRALAARAMAQGVARYFAARGGAVVILAPEPPTAPRLIGAGERLLELAWSAPAADAAGGDAPTGYRVYLSRDGRGFDDGTDVTGTSMMLDAPADGGAIYARVTATNAGGESFPSRVVGARPGASGHARVLVIGGFDRLDRSMLIADDLSDYALATIERGLIERINDGSHLARYGAALDAARVSFDAADDAGSVDLGDYALVIWQLGEESSADDPLDATRWCSPARSWRGRSGPRATSRTRCSCPTCCTCATPPTTPGPTPLPPKTASCSRGWPRCPSTIAALAATTPTFPTCSSPGTARPSRCATRTAPAAARRSSGARGTPRVCCSSAFRSKPSLARPSAPRSWRGSWPGSGSRPIRSRTRIPMRRT